MKKSTSALLIILQILFAPVFIILYCAKLTK